MSDNASYFSSTQHKCWEAEYFFTKMLDNYHMPWDFMFNLNAFIQAVRNITFMMQSEDDKPEGFAEWYQIKQTEMRSNPILRKFVEARNIIVKQRTLTSKSSAWLGLFRGRRMKLAFQHEIPPFTETKQALEIAQSFAIGFFLDEEHLTLPRC